MRGLAVALTVYINTVFSTEKKKKKITYFVSKNRMGNGAETLWAWFEKAF